MSKINYNLKKSLKEMIEVLIPGDMYTDQHFYKMLNLSRKVGLEGAAMQLLGAMPTSKKAYEIEAFIDVGDNPPAYTGWDMLGGAEPDKFVINGRQIDKNGYKPCLEEDRINRNMYPNHKFSCKKGNLIMHVYTSR